MNFILSSGSNDLQNQETNKVGKTVILHWNEKYNVEKFQSPKCRKIAQIELTFKEFSNLLSKQCPFLSNLCLVAQG